GLESEVLWLVSVLLFRTTSAPYLLRSYRVTFEGHFEANDRLEKLLRLYHTQYVLRQVMQTDLDLCDNQKAQIIKLQYASDAHITLVHHKFVIL
uniref:hypothetical protein n=1 Tax=Pseudomonas viridiflava TaxID=33069 RepID=UPI0019D07C02